MSIIDAVKTIYLATGQVAIPENWIIVHNPFGDDIEATDLVVVEARNWESYGVPHFAIPISKAQLTKEDCDRIIEACCDVYPGLLEVIAMQVEPPMTSPVSDPDYWAKVKASLESPYLGIFRVTATDDDFYDPDHEYPFGVVVIRNKVIYDMEK